MSQPGDKRDSSTPHLEIPAIQAQVLHPLVHVRASDVEKTMAQEGSGEQSSRSMGGFQVINARSNRRKERVNGRRNQVAANARR